jgi:sugar/nucleoside kinase (ribokinase family)
MIYRIILDGLDDRISSLITVAREKRTPVVFALNRRRLGQSLNKIVKMSVVVISNADGGHDKLQAVLETSELVRQLSAIQYKQQQLHVRQLVGIKGTFI